MAKKAWKDPRGEHTRIYDDILDSPAWAVLSISARVLFIEFRSSMGKTNNGDLACPMTVATKRGAFKSATTLARALFELRAVGLIAVTRAGGVRFGSKMATLYRFTDEPFAQFTKDGIYTFGPGKATCDWTKFKTIEEAQAALDAGVAELHGDAARTHTRTKKSFSTLHILERDAPHSGVEGTPGDAPDSGVERPLPRSTIWSPIQVGSGGNSSARSTRPPVNGSVNGAASAGDLPAPWFKHGEVRLPGKRPLDVVMRPCKFPGCVEKLVARIPHNATHGKAFDNVNCPLHRRRNNETRAQTAARIAAEQAALRPGRRPRPPGPPNGKR